MSPRTPWLLSLVLGFVACSSSPDDTGTPMPTVELGDSIQVVPSSRLPESVVPQASNNNLDVVEHTDGKLYFAFRTGPDHFANEAVHLYVLSSSDQGETWQPEISLFMGTDLREPRFLSWNGDLILHYAVLGTDPMDFEPQGTMRTVKTGESWSEPEWVFADGFIPWRTRVMQGEPTMIGYTGGADIYDPNTDTLPNLKVRWLTSDNGLDWNGPVVWTGGGSETDFTFTENALVAVIRNEAGDAEGFGSLVCRAELNQPEQWDCIHDCRKFDSPLVFEHAGEAWLIGRRNVTETGCFDLGNDPSAHTHGERFLQYSVAYWQEPKRCALWHVDDETLEVTHVLDLPSAGDTCFPSILGKDGAFEVWNYSTDPAYPDTSWLEGQNGETNIYRQSLSFHE